MASWLRVCEIAGYLLVGRTDLAIKGWKAGASEGKGWVPTSGDSPTLDAAGEAGCPASDRY